jgi:hypothetical protein
MCSTSLGCIIVYDLYFTWRRKFVVCTLQGMASCTQQILWKLLTLVNQVYKSIDNICLLEVQNYLSKNIYWYVFICCCRFFSHIRIEIETWINVERWMMLSRSLSILYVKYKYQKSKLSQHNSVNQNLLEFIIHVYMKWYWFMLLRFYYEQSQIIHLESFIFSYLPIFKSKFIRSTWNFFLTNLKFNSFH